MVKLDPMCLQGFGLGDGTGHTVQDITAGAVGLGQPLLNDADDDLVGNQLAGIHIGLGLQAMGVPALTAARRILPVEMVGMFSSRERTSGLGAFAGARWP